jgi:hypothetical protein
MTKYMLLQSYAPAANCDVPMSEWPEQDITAHIRFQLALNELLTSSGELVDFQGLTPPEQAKIVTADANGGAIVTDGPFPEFKELLAGYRIVDVDTESRVIEIAKQASAAPGPGGAPMGIPIEVRQIMDAPPVDL